MSDSPSKIPAKYSIKSDGSPEMIEYRNKVNMGELPKRGRPFLTAEERAESLRKRKEYIATFRSKRKRTRRKSNDFMTYDEARDRIQNEGIRTVLEYKLWHKLNHPARMPQSPDAYYTSRGKWLSWGDFLGIVNAYPRISKKRWRPYKEAKAYVHNKAFGTIAEWRAFCKSGKCPEDIPHRPDVAYFKTGDWFSWREFLGPKCKIELGKAIQMVNDKVLYVLKVNDTNNARLYRIGVTVGGWSSITDAIKKHNLRFVDAFVITPETDWKTFIHRFGEPSWEGEGVYQIDNVYELTMALGEYYPSYRKEDSEK